MLIKEVLIYELHICYNLKHKDKYGVYIKKCPKESGIFKKQLCYSLFT